MMEKVRAIVEMRFVRPSDTLPNDEVMADPAEVDAFAEYLVMAHAATIDRGDLVRAAEIERQQRTPERTLLVRRRVSRP
jgi:hypothetical protein